MTIAIQNRKNTLQTMPHKWPQIDILFFARRKKKTLTGKEPHKEEYCKASPQPILSKAVEFKIAKSWRLRPPLHVVVNQVNALQIFLVNQVTHSNFKPEFCLKSKKKKKNDLRIRRNLIGIWRAVYVTIR